MSMPAFLRSADTPSISPLFTPTADMFGDMGVSMNFTCGEEIYAQGEETDLVYQVQSGAVRASRLTSDGRRQIAGFYYPGNLFGLETGPAHLSSAEALGPTRVLVVRRSAMRYHGEAGHGLERAIWRATGSELERAHEHMMLLARKSALEKVAGFLSDLAARQPAAWNELAMSRQDIADHLGLSIETVSRMFSQLQDEGLIVLEGCRRFRVMSHARLAKRAAL